MQHAAYLLVDTTPFRIAQEVVEVDQVIEQGSLITEPGMIQDVSCCRSLRGVTV